MCGIPNNISSGISGLEKYIPITVIFAIALFVVRELLEFLKQRNSKKNKLKAISFLFSEEIKINYWALKSLFRAYNTLANLFDEFPNSTYRIKTTRFEKMVFKYKREPDDTIWSGHPIPKFSFDKFNFLLPSLAELNLNIANIVKITYEKIIELEHFRETIILFLADELHEEDVFKEMTKNFIADFTKEETDYFNSLNEAYKTLTGTELKEWRVR